MPVLVFPIFYNKIHLYLFLGQFLLLLVALAYWIYLGFRERKKKNK
jgi:hypothetical protein